VNPEGGVELEEELDVELCPQPLRTIVRAETKAQAIFSNVNFGGIFNPVRIYFG
jgi:hypothetical protein